MGWGRGHVYRIAMVMHMSPATCAVLDLQTMASHLFCSLNPGKAVTFTKAMFCFGVDVEGDMLLCRVHTWLRCEQALQLPVQVVRLARRALDLVSTALQL